MLSVGKPNFLSWSKVSSRVFSVRPVRYTNRQCLLHFCRTSGAKGIGSSSSASPIPTFSKQSNRSQNLFLARWHVPFGLTMRTSQISAPNRGFLSPPWELHDPIAHAKRLTSFVQCLSMYRQHQPQR